MTVSAALSNPNDDKLQEAGAVGEAVLGEGSDAQVLEHIDTADAPLVDAPLVASSLLRSPRAAAGAGDTSPTSDSSFMLPMAPVASAHADTFAAPVPTEPALRFQRPQQLPLPTPSTYVTPASTADLAGGSKSRADFSRRVGAGLSGSFVQLSERSLAPAVAPTWGRDDLPGPVGLGAGPSSPRHISSMPMRSIPMKAANELAAGASGVYNPPEVASGARSGAAVDNVALQPTCSIARSPAITAALSDGSGAADGDHDGDALSGLARGSAEHGEYRFSKAQTTSQETDGGSGALQQHAQQGRGRSARPFWTQYGLLSSSPHAPLPRLLERAVLPWLLHPFGRVAVLLILLGAMVASAFGATRLQEGYTIADLAPDGHFVGVFDRADFQFRRQAGALCLTRYSLKIHVL